VCVCGDCGQLLLWTKCSEKCFLLCCWRNPWHWWKAHMQSNLLYIRYIWWPLTTKGTLWGT
jgi:hypothetical protein